MASDQIIQHGFQALVRAVDVNNKLLSEQNRILRELVEATQLANDTPLRALESMLAEDAPDVDTLEGDEGVLYTAVNGIGSEGPEPWRKVSEPTTKRRSQKDEAEALPESERWRLGE